MKDKETQLPGAPETKSHPPRPVKPEDESYGELMMRFTAHPVKPKYWFEEFGDHWTCSCGQINKGETCSNCGLERDLLRKLFILHKPDPDGNPSEQPADPSLFEGSDSAADGSPAQDGPKAGPGGAKAGGQKAGGQKAGSCGAKTGSGNSSDSSEDTPSGGHRNLILGLVIVIVLLLLGTGAFLYFVLFPEMQEQNDAKRDSVRISLCENLPVATAPIPKAQRKSYVSAGNMLCRKGKYQKSLTYYNKAADLKDDESIKQKILDAKFGYVKAHQEKGDGYFETYLNELVEAGYDGSRAIYDQYYAWHVNIVANNIKDDFSTDMENVNRSDMVYFHTTVTGGAPNDSLRLYYQIIWPNGNAETKDVDSTWSAGSHFTTRFQYAMPLLSKPGKLTFELYDKDSHDLLGTDSIKLQK